MAGGIIDIGNSRAKVCGLSEDGWPLDVRGVELAGLLGVLEEGALEGAGWVIVACSGDLALQGRVVDWLEGRGVIVFVVDGGGELPFGSDYAAGQAGIDRLANVAGALEMGGGPLVVVDAGSAITLEVVGGDNRFLGGAILPGLSMLAGALRMGTAALPYARPDGEVVSIGRDTVSAIHAGVFHACAGGIERLLRIVLGMEGMEGVRVIVTGGNGLVVERMVLGMNLGVDVVVVPGLTLRGLFLLARFQFGDKVGG